MLELEVNGTDFIYCLEVPATKVIVLIGEIWGYADELASDYLIQYNTSRKAKPVVTYVAGLIASPGRRIGHTGAIITEGKGGAMDKIKASEKTNVIVTRPPAKTGVEVHKEMKQLEI